MFLLDHQFGLHLVKMHLLNSTYFKAEEFFQANFLRLDLGLVSWTYNNSLHQHDLVDVFLHLVDR